MDSPGQLIAAAYHAEASSAARILLGERTPAMAVELARDASARLDALLASLPDTGALVCRAKCAWCCHERVACSPAEAISAAAYVQTRLVKRDRARVVERLDAYAERVKGLDLATRDGLRLACPFLDGGICVVHRARPLVCRAWHSYDVEQCKRRWAGESAGVTVNDIRLRLRVAVSGAMADALEWARPARPIHATLDLAAAARIALEQPGAAAAWVRGEDVFASAEYGERPS